MFEKILIANRGEIACRVAHTCKRLGVRTVAVYSDADTHARHVALCDEAYLLGPAPARDSYLKADLLLQIARQSGAQAIHPGYGFLSENAEFAEACQTAGVVFIGPPPKAIRAMGSKSAAKAIMEQAGVPLVPGYHGKDQTLDTLARSAAEIGYPVLIKASAGGGGKGMRVVESAGQLAEGVAAAQREALASFGDDQVLIEKYLFRPRHIEIQVFADKQGQAVYLFERDCSVQRRHQKILEEAPAPGMSPERRREMGEAAVAAARAIGYEGAGTVEFIAHQDGSFYFMEMNTRLQVEHPVTEMITGQDLVEWQLLVAAGEPLPRAQEQLAIQGHAFEARIYAEDPDRDFLPSIGRLEHLRTPAENLHVRIDTGVRQNDEVSPHYDPMIAKLIVWDQDRGGALRRLGQALADYQIVGVATNIRLLSALVAHPAFAAGEVNTGFIEIHRSSLFPDKQPVSDHILALATLGRLLYVEREAASRAHESGDPWSPWRSTSAWRLNDDNMQTLYFRDGERDVSVTAHYHGDHVRLDLPGGSLPVSGELKGEGDLVADLDGVRVRATLVRQGEDMVILSQGASHLLTLHNPLTEGMEDEVDAGSLAAPMPGTVTRILVQEGDTVATGDPLLILEAMKMEHTITAPRAGMIECIHYTVGDQVQEGVELLVLGGTP
ncbi:MAG: acetyl/propionyl/methylcrotonyl-CoA carboxylase subunit alpha [Gammaproteobacteria bacterium]|nr:acetyl/propionyl/methylcrotonyl-CoA carboxylase subunit alpha [Gammaproteobacteria bacterium]MCP5458862.1 acetyl/propionyl/methylcrotonyl-CoA carboxylase subunit alpha [Gammaproteobacteria bacterium]